MRHGLPSRLVEALESKGKDTPCNVMGGHESVLWQHPGEGQLRRGSPRGMGARPARGTGGAALGKGRL